MPSQLAPITQQDLDISTQARFQNTVLTAISDHKTTLITATGPTDYADVVYLTEYAIQVVNGATNSVIWTPEGSIDGVVWVPLGYKVQVAGGAASETFATGARTTAAGASEVLFISADNYLRYLRANIGTANALGSTFTAGGQS